MDNIVTTKDILKIASLESVSGVDIIHDNGDSLLERILISNKKLDREDAWIIDEIMNKYNSEKVGFFMRIGNYYKK